jgi:hypothetical protein
LISDNGSEFINNEFQKNLNQSKIQHQTAEPGYHPTLGVVDAFSKNVKNALFRYFTEYDTTKWIDVLDTVIDNYNNTPHSGIANYAPNEVHLHEEEIENLNIAKNQNATVGDTVRRKLKKARFEKGYKIIWTCETYKIVALKVVNAELENGAVGKIE